MSGHDPRDATSSQRECMTFIPESGEDAIAAFQASGIRVGIPQVSLFPQGFQHSMMKEIMKPL